MKILILAALITSSAFAGTIKHSDCRVYLQAWGMTSVSEQNLAESLNLKGYEVVAQDAGAALRLTAFVDTQHQEQQERQVQEEQVIEGMEPSIWERLNEGALKTSQKISDAFSDVALAIDNRFYAIGYVIEDGSQRVTRNFRNGSSTGPKVLAHKSSNFVTSANGENVEFVSRHMARIPRCEIK